MRWRPEEKDESERQRYGADLRVGCRGASQHGPTAREAAKDDVQPGTTLEPDGIDDGVEEGAKENVEGRPRVQCQPRSADRGDGQCADD